MKQNDTVLKIIDFIRSKETKLDFELIDALMRLHEEEAKTLLKMLRAKIIGRDDFIHMLQVRSRNKV